MNILLLVSGKSTFLRQNALFVVMAQVGPVLVYILQIVLWEIPYPIHNFYF